MTELFKVTYGAHGLHLIKALGAKGLAAAAGGTGQAAGLENVLAGRGAATRLAELLSQPRVELSFIRTWGVESGHVARSSQAVWQNSPGFSASLCVALWKGLAVSWCNGSKSVLRTRFA